MQPRLDDNQTIRCSRIKGKYWNNVKQRETIANVLYRVKLEWQEKFKRKESNM